MSVIPQLNGQGRKSLALTAKAQLIDDVAPGG